MGETGAPSCAQHRPAVHANSPGTGGGQRKMGKGGLPTDSAWPGGKLCSTNAAEDCADFPETEVWVLQGTDQGPSSVLSSLADRGQSAVLGVRNKPKAERLGSCPPETRTTVETGVGHAQTCTQYRNVHTRCTRDLALGEPPRPGHLQGGAPAGLRTSLDSAVEGKWDTPRPIKVADIPVRKIP